MTGSRRPAPAPVRRVIVVVADGLRPDVIPLLDLPVLGRLLGQGAATLTACTVAPSVTAAAMGSLLTGVEPRVHGLTSDRFRNPGRRPGVEPMPLVLRDAGVRATAWMASLPWIYRPLASRLVRRLGFAEAEFAGDDAFGILNAALRDLSRRQDGLWLMHWPDADRAGHAAGWPSPAYLRAARRIDECLGTLVRRTGVTEDPDAMLVVLADHGGGGRRRRDHDSAHPLDRTIPIVIAGGRVARRHLPANASLLDVPPTIVDALGVAVPRSWSGRSLFAHAMRSDRQRAMPSREWPMATAS